MRRRERGTSIIMAFGVDGEAMLVLMVARDVEASMVVVNGAKTADAGAS